MKSKLLFLYICAIQSISGYSNTFVALYPPQKGFIVGGTNALDGQFPYQCSLQNLNHRHFCGCAILSSKWIISAAHCIDEDSPEDVVVLVGTNNLKEGGTRYAFEKIIPHKSYGNPRFAYDIAVLKVKDNIEFNDKVQPIEYSADEIAGGSVSQLTGWGRLSHPGGSTPDNLQVLNLTVISTPECRKINGEYVHDGHLCTFNKEGEGACHGDSGGPLVLNNKLIGIVNWGRPCAQGYPDAYAKISYFYDWVKENTESE